MKLHEGHGKRVLLAVVVVALVVFALSDALAPQIEALLGRSEEILRNHEVLGKVLFTSLAVVSPMLAFFTSAVLVPVAVSAWGVTTTFLLLWLGWIGGGMTAYTIARFLGRAAVHRLASTKLAYYEERVSSDVRWWMLLLLQLALPSELPGYLAGLLRIRFHHYVAALALGELPYAIGSVFLGDAFLQGNVLAFTGALLAGLALISGAFHVLHVQLARRSPASAPSAPSGNASAPSSAPSAPSSTPVSTASTASTSEGDAQFEPASPSMAGSS